MKPVTAIVLVAIASAVFLFSRASTPGGDIAWRSWNDGMAAAKAEHKPVLVDFSAKWCGVCTRLDRTTLSDPRVIEAIHAGWVAIRVDVDREPERARDLQIEALPTLVVLTADGKEAARRRGYVSSNGLLDWLQKSRSAG